MATAAQPQARAPPPAAARARPPPGARRGHDRRRRAARALVYAPWYLNYDARYALLWARDISHGLTPDYQARVRAHAAPAVDRAGARSRCRSATDGDRLIVWLMLLSFGALV